MEYKVIEERKLKSEWHPVYDNNDAFHMIDCENELVYFLSKLITKQMNEKNNDKYPIDHEKT